MFGLLSDIDFQGLGDPPFTYGFPVNRDANCATGG
jgi:hypothetical protein